MLKPVVKENIKREDKAMSDELYGGSVRIMSVCCNGCEQDERAGWAAVWLSSGWDERGRLGGRLGGGDGVERALDAAATHLTSASSVNITCSQSTWHLLSYRVFLLRFTNIYSSHGDCKQIYYYCKHYDIFSDAKLIKAKYLLTLRRCWLHRPTYIGL